MNTLDVFPNVANFLQKSDFEKLSVKALYYTVLSV